MPGLSQPESRQEISFRSCMPRGRLWGKQRSNIHNEIEFFLTKLLELFKGQIKFLSSPAGDGLRIYQKNTDILNNTKQTLDLLNRYLNC